MIYFEMYDLPDQVLNLAEEVYPTEDGFISYLQSFGIQDTRKVSELKWDEVYEDLLMKNNQDDEY